MVCHEQIALGVIEALEADGFDAYAGEPDSRAASPHEEPVENADVPGDQRRRKADDGGDGRRQNPECQQQGGADHGAAAPLSGCDSPLSHAARRARCSGVI